ncbi:MAG: tetratricopeptide repeat protein [Pseudonocardia sp.]
MPGAASAGLAREWPVTQVGVAGADSDRSRWFVAALREYRRALDGDAGYDPPDVGAVGEPGEPMMVTTTRAVLAAAAGGTRADVDAVRVAGSGELAARLVGHEQRRWAESAADPRWKLDAPGVTDDVLAQAVLGLVLAGPTSVERAVEIVRRLPALCTPTALAPAVVAWAAHLYPGSAAGGAPLPAPSPEFLAAALVARCAEPDRRALVDAVFGGPGTDAGALAGLARAAAWFPAAAALLAAALVEPAQGSDLPTPDRAVAAVEAAALAGPRAQLAVRAVLLDALARAAPPLDAVVRLLVVTDGAGLDRVRVQLHRLVVEHARAEAGRAGGDAEKARLAAALDDLEGGLHDVGDSHAAVAVQREAVGLWRVLAAARPEYVGRLARSLSALGNGLADVGDHDGAVTAAGEAVDLVRVLVDGEPLRYEPDLVGRLTELGWRTRGVGGQRAALGVAQEAVTLARRLVAADPARHVARFASALDCYAGCLEDVGEYRAGAEASREAVAVWRLLARARPGRYSASLAAALANCGHLLQGLREHRESVELLRAAAGLYRQLAEAEPARYRGSLAQTLNNLGNSLAGIGAHPEALALTEEAVAIRRTLAHEAPVRYRSDLAEALGSLGNRLGDVGKHHQSVDAARESLAIRRELAVERPDRYAPEIALSANNLAAALSIVDGHAEALAVIDEAVTLRRGLAIAEPVRYTVLLAGSLHNRAIVLQALDRAEEARAAEAEAVAWWGGSTGCGPGSSPTPT